MKVKDLVVRSIGTVALILLVVILGGSGAGPRGLTRAMLWPRTR